MTENRIKRNGNYLEDASLIVHVYGFSDVWVQPFATKTDELVNSVISHWSFEKKESISSRYPTPSSPIKEWKTLSYVWDDWQQRDQDGIT
jgi:hypothetical protein